MSRKSRNRKHKPIPQPVDPVEQIQAEVIPIHPQPSGSGSHYPLRYGQILPHELGLLTPLIKDFYKEIGYKEAMENPEPFLQEIIKDIAHNPYSIIYTCVDEDLRPHGYIYFKIERNPVGQGYVTIEHDYVITEHRETMKEARIQHEFINYVLEVGERCNCQYVNTAIKTEKLEKSRMKLGFKSVELKMTFRGTAQDFRNQNPSFQKYRKYEEVSNE